MSKQNITKLTEEILTGYLEGKPLEIWRVEYKKEGKDHILRVYIDKPGGYISTDDCEDVSRYLSDRLDEADPVAGNYYLEVSSPGMDRQLYTLNQYEQYLGHEVEIKLFAALEGRKKYEGILTGATAEKVTLDEESGRVEIPFEMISKTKLKVVI